MTIGHESIDTHHIFDEVLFSPKVYHDIFSTEAVQLLIIILMIFERIIDDVALLPLIGVEVCKNLLKKTLTHLALSLFP